MRTYLRELRKTKDMSQATIADRLNISQHYYSNIEHGTRMKDMPYSFMVKLAEVFEVGIDYITNNERR